MITRYIIFGLISLLSAITACQSHSTDPYTLIAYDTAENIRMGTLSSVDNGHIDLTKGSTTNNELFFTHKGNAYYSIANDTGSLVKYELRDGHFNKSQEMPFGQITGWTPVASWYSWVSDRELLIGSSRRGRHFMYALVDVESMKILKHGDLNIPLPPTGMRYGGVMGRLADTTLYIAYMIYRYDDRKAPAGDTTYLASVSFPNMKTRNITKDVRSTFPGGYNLFWQVSLIHDGYLYFIEEPGSRLRYHPRHRPAMLRIKIGDDHIDPDYFFPLQDGKGREFYGLFDIGKGKALVKSIDSAAIKEFPDFFYARIATYYELDLINKTRSKLNFPLDRLGFYPNVLAADSLVYVSIADTAGSSHIWSYSPGRGRYHRGPKINGQVMFLNKTQ